MYWSLFFCLPSGLWTKANRCNNQLICLHIFFLSHALSTWIFFFFSDLRLWFSFSFRCLCACVCSSLGGRLCLLSVSHSVFVLRLSLCIWHPVMILFQFVCFTWLHVSVWAFGEQRFTGTPNKCHLNPFSFEIISSFYELSYSENGFSRNIVYHIHPVCLSTIDRLMQWSLEQCVS